MVDTNQNGKFAHSLESEQEFQNHFGYTNHKKT